jgi:hypothetical protein
MEGLRMKNSDFSVPCEIIKGNMTDSYIELKTEYESLWHELNALMGNQSKLYTQIKDIVHPMDKYGHRYAYTYEEFKERKAWQNVLTLQGVINQAVENEALVQEINVKYIEVGEKIKDIYGKCGLNPKWV